MQNSYLHKIKDFKIVPGEFTNDAGNKQSYLSVQLVVTSDGIDETLNLSGGSATKPSALKLALKGADDIRQPAKYDTNNTILDDDN